MKRRSFLAAASTAGLAPVLARGQLPSTPASAAPGDAGPLLAGPPVVQHVSVRGFAVSIHVTRLATGRVEWGTAPDRLDHRAVASRHGLVDAGRDALVIPVEFPRAMPPGATVHYRVVASDLVYHGAYKLERGPEEATAVRALRLPDPATAAVRFAMVNDTHQNPQSLPRLLARVEALAPQGLLWCGDTCNDFDAQDNPAAILLAPAADPARPTGGGWASTRPLFFVPGNHDVRGERARDVRAVLADGPVPGLPRNFALRDGPLALLGLDTGEDKPDAHPVFAGTAAYEPYRERQAAWLRGALREPGIVDAPFKFAVCHIPLRGRPGDNPGTTLEGFAGYCGDAARHWLPVLREAGVRMVLSGHTHRWRIDDATADEPVMQLTGGGPKPDEATVTVIDARAGEAEIRIEDPDGKVLDRRTLARA